MIRTSLIPHGLWALILVTTVVQAAGTETTDKTLLGSSAGVDKISGSQNVFLGNDVDAVKRLIADSSNLDSKDYSGNTALHVAAFTGHLEIVTLLINAGANIEAGARGHPDKRFYDATPLSVATQRGHKVVAELLVSAGADVNAEVTDFMRAPRSVLFFAALAGHTSIAELLIANGASIESKGDTRQYTPLLITAMKGHSRTAELLIGSGADVNAIDFHGKTSLHHAATSGNTDLVQLLLANGADINAKTVGGDSPGETPLHATAYLGHTRFAELLLADGAKGQLTMAELLIKKGADAATTDKYGLTPLHIVAQTDRIAIAELLISSGADINAKDINSGFTPLDYAQDGYEEMIEMLERHGGNCTSC